MLKKLENKMRKVLGPKTISPIAKPKVSKIVKYSNAVTKATAPNTPIGYIPSRSIEIGKGIADFALRDPLSKVSVKQKPKDYAKQAVSVLAKDKGIQDITKKSIGVGIAVGSVAGARNLANKQITKRGAQLIRKAPSRSLAKAPTKAKSKTTSDTVHKANKARMEKLERANAKRRAKDLERKYKLQDKNYFKERKKK